MFRTTEMVINMGPQHPSTHGVLRIVLRLDGETVVDSKPVVGYLHRGIEKLSENKTYGQITPLTDRLDYIASFSENLGYIGAVEKLLGIDVPQRANYIRVILAELQRMASHLIWLATHALDIGAMTVFLYCFREREMILDLFESFCGARLTYHAVRIGGLLEDLPEGWVEECRKFCEIFPSRLKDYEDLLSENRIWLQRTIGIGVISAEDAVNMGLSGPMLRGSGVNWDIRKAMPYAAYRDFDFHVPLGKNGDTYDRYLIRLEEMRQSRRIILQALDKLPDGEIRTKIPRRIKPPAGEAYHSVEGPRGEMGFYLISDGSEKPYRVKFRSPCFVNLQSLPRLIEGHLVADIVAIIGTLDVVLGCVDR